MLMVGDNQWVTWITSSPLFPSERLSKVLHRTFRSRLEWREVCGTFPSFWLLPFKLRVFPVNYLNWQIFFFLGGGNKNTSAYISAPFAFFFKMFFLATFQRWCTWINGPLVSPTAVFLLFLLKYQQQSQPLKTVKKKIILDTFYFYCYCTDTTKYFVNFLGRRLILDLFWGK